MKLNTPLLLPTLAIYGLAFSAVFGDLTISGIAPSVNGADVANLTWTSSREEKTFNDTTNHGQSFTTGSDADGYTLNSFSLQTNRASIDPHPNDRSWNIRVVAIDENGDTTTIVLETGHTQAAGSFALGDWFTWALDTPVSLSPDTQYGIDVEHITGSDWRQGIPYLRANNTDDIAGGNQYNRTDGDPSAIVNNQVSRDFVFHIDLAIGGGGGSFSTWVSGFNVNGQTGISDDPDGDGIGNGVENFFGTAPDNFSQGIVPGTVSGNTFTFTHPQGTLASDLTAAYLWTKDLQTFNEGGDTDTEGSTVEFSTQLDTPILGTTTVTATVSGTPVEQLFFAVQVN